MIKGDAKFSDDGLYRWWLTRQWHVGKLPIAWMLLNPSTATATEDDPTIRRCIGFSKDWGYGSLVILNLFALRSTDPKALRGELDPVGQLNPGILRAMAQTYPMVLGWGANARYFDDHVQRTLDELDAVKREPLMCLGVTKDGHPKHPLYLAADTPLQPFVVPKPPDLVAYLERMHRDDHD